MALINDEFSSFGITSGADLTEAGLKLRAKPFIEAFRRQLPVLSEIQDIQRHFGVEIAQEVFCSAVEAADTFGEFVRLLRTFRFENTPRTREAARATEVLVVPSVLPQAGKAWGAHLDSWREWARQLGFTTDDVLTSPKASIRENAYIIGQHLKMQPHPQRILVTYSQGAAEMRALIRRSREKETGFENLKYWINICGAVNGSSSSQFLISSALRRMRSKFILRKRNRNALMETSPSYGLYNEPLLFGRGPRIVNIVGMPFRSQIPQGLNSLYYQLAKEQPSDGVVCLFEALAQPGFIVPVRGMSHRAEEHLLKPVLQRVLGVIAAEQASLVTTGRPMEAEL